MTLDIHFRAIAGGVPQETGLFRLPLNGRGYKPADIEPYMLLWRAKLERSFTRVTGVACYLDGEKEPWITLDNSISL